MRQGVPSESRCFHAPASLRLSEQTSALEVQQAAGAAHCSLNTRPALTRRQHVQYPQRAPGGERKTPARRADVHSMCLAYSTPPPVQCAQTQQAPSPSRAEDCATNFESQLSSHPPLLPKHSIWTGTQSSLGLSLPQLAPLPGFPPPLCPVA